VSRLGDWWRSANAKPQATVRDPGRATIAYPELDRRELEAFGRCETYLLREVVEARSWGRAVDARGVPFPTNGWLIMPDRMLEVYRHLAAADTDWGRAASG